ncbi:MAG: hypothetical protein ACOCVG_00955 [Verrucomicrobiota bacterium]
MEIFPMEELRERLARDGRVAGEWHTVVRGSEIEVFELEIIGIAENFVGPQRPAFIAEASGPINVLSGPVAGMSGSPVYVDGRLAGAYAYGYLWPKEQALIGIQPIDNMLEVIEKYPLEGVKPEVTEAATDWRPARAEPTAASHLGSRQAEVAALRPLPAPLFAGGFSQRTLNEFADEFAALGIEPMQGPGTGSGTAAVGAEALTPGAPVAGVMMDGDFSMAGTGTVTWREGDQVLGFGHPFFQFGDLQMPMAAAEIITVVRSVPRSFKLSNTGAIVGTISQDRLTAIGGTIGDAPPMIDYRISVEAQPGQASEFSGRMFIHGRFSPLLAAIATFEALGANIDADLEETIEADLTLRFPERESLRLSNLYSGVGAGGGLARELLQLVAALMTNPLEQAEISAIEVDIRKRPVLDLRYLRGVTVEGSAPRAGETLTVALHTRDFRGEPQRRLVEVPIPEHAGGQTLTLWIADANTINREQGFAGFFRPDFESVDDILDAARQRLPQDAIYLRLLGQQDGLRVDGANLEGLPPSVRELATSPKSGQRVQTLSDYPLWEHRIRTSGVFQGSYRLSFQVE